MLKTDYSDLNITIEDLIDYECKLKIELANIQAVKEKRILRLKEKERNG